MINRFPITSLAGLAFLALLLALLLIFLIRWALTGIRRLSEERPQNMVWRFARDLSEFTDDILCLVWSFGLLFGTPIGFGIIVVCFVGELLLR